MGATGSHCSFKMGKLTWQRGAGLSWYLLAWWYCDALITEQACEERGSKWRWAESTCPEDGICGCYLVSETKFDWYGCQTYCTDHNSTLATWHTKDAYQAKLAGGITRSVDLSTVGFWIGLYAPYPTSDLSAHSASGSWRWVNGEAVGDLWWKDRWVNNVKVQEPTTCT